MPKIIIIGIVILAVVVAAALWVWQSAGNNPSKFTVQGINVEILREGRGNPAVAGNVLTVDYSGMLTDGVKFDSSYDRGQSFSFTLGAGRVIKGWDVGLAGMKIGEKRKLTVPPEMAYGERGFPVVGIPQNATLIFEVELLRIRAN